MTNTTTLKTPALAAGLEAARRVAPPKQLTGAAPTKPAEKTYAVGGVQKKLADMTPDELRAALAEATTKKGGAGGPNFGRVGNGERVLFDAYEGREGSTVAAKGDSKAYDKKAKRPCQRLTLQPPNRKNAIQLTVAPGGGFSASGVGRRGVHGGMRFLLAAIANPAEVLDFAVINRDVSIECILGAALESEAAKPANKRKDVVDLRNDAIAGYDSSLRDTHATLTAAGIKLAPLPDSVTNPGAAAVAAAGEAGDE